MKHLTHELDTKGFYFDGDEAREEWLTEGTYESFLLEMADETTTPRGVAPRFHLREDGEGDLTELWTWGVTGNNPELWEAFDSEEEAKEAIYLTFEEDVQNEDQRPTDFFLSREEADSYLQEKW